MKSIESFPSIRLGILPTPIHKHENITSLLGQNIYIKRDDMTDSGSAASCFDRDDSARHDGRSVLSACRL